MIPLVCLGGGFLITGVYIDLTRSGNHVELIVLGSMCALAAGLSGRIAVERVRPGVPFSIPDADDISIR